MSVYNTSASAVKDRWTTERVLSAIRDPGSDPVPTLLAALHASDASVRLLTVQMLREMPSPRAVAPLLPLLRDRDTAVRSETAETLGFLGDSAALPALLEAADDPDDMVRVNIAEALGSLGVRSSSPRPSTLIRVLLRLLQDPYFPTRVFAAESLGDLEDPLALPLLQQRRSDIPPVRVWVFYALARLGEPFPLTETLRLLRYGGVWARTQAARVLRRIAPEGASARILTALQVALKRPNPPLVHEALSDYFHALQAEEWERERANRQGQEGASSSPDSLTAASGPRKEP